MSPRPAWLGRRIRRRTPELTVAFATLRKATPRDRRDPAYRAAVLVVEQNLADLEALGRDLPGLLHQMRQAGADRDQEAGNRETRVAERQAARLILNDLRLECA